MKYYLNMIYKKDYKRNILCYFPMEVISVGNGVMRWCRYARDRFGKLPTHLKPMTDGGIFYFFITLMTLTIGFLQYRGYRLEYNRIEQFFILNKPNRYLLGTFETIKTRCAVPKKIVLWRITSKKLHGN